MFFSTRVGSFYSNTISWRDVGISHQEEWFNYKQTICKLKSILKKNSKNFPSLEMLILFMSFLIGKEKVEF